MRKKVWSTVLIISMIGTMFAGGCRERIKIPKGTEWVRESIEKINGSDVVQINSITKKTMKDGTKESQEEKIIIDKKEKLYYNNTVIKSADNGEIEKIIYAGVENGQSYQIGKEPGDEAYVKQVLGEESILKPYLEIVPIKITEKTKIKVLGQDTIDETACIKVKLVTEDFQRIQDKEEMKAFYEAAKISVKYQEQLQVAEKEYESYKEETTVWFNENLEVIKAENDNTISNKLIDIILAAYFDVNGAETDENDMIEKTIRERKFLTGEQCEKIEMPTEYEVIEE